MNEIIIDKNAKQIIFMNNGIGFSQFGVANEILDLIENQAKEIERLNKIINELEHDFESYELEYLQDTYQGSLADFIETELERIHELRGEGK